MLRKKFATEKKSHKDPIRWRGHEVTRIEAFSDAVFAFGVTLLIVALEVPKNYEELMESMTQFFPFAICFFILFLIWRSQNIFFRRYGLHDNLTLALNGALLFVTLFFVYPLKFLWTGLITNGIHIDTIGQARNLFYIYSGGFTVIYLLFTLMYHNAWRKREFLSLTAEEIFETRTQVYMQLAIASGGIYSLILASLPYPFIQFSGIVYFLIWPMAMLVRKYRDRSYYKKFHRDMEADVAEAEIEDQLKTVRDDELN